MMPAALAEFRPPLGWPVTMTLVLVVGAFALWLSVRHERRPGMLALRLVAIAALGGVLLGPGRDEPGSTADPAKPELVLLVDTSISMAEEDVALPGRAGLVSRLDAVGETWLTDATLARLRAVAEVRIVAFDEQARPAQPGALAADGRATRLHDAADRFDDAIVVLLSDGHDTTDGSARAGAGNRGVLRSAAFAVPVGSTRGAPDLAVHAWPESDRLFEGQTTRVGVQVYQRGFAGQAVRVELMHDGVVEQTRDLALDASLVQVSFEVAPELGPREPTRVHGYTCRATVLGGVDEAYIDNNEEHTFIQVTREQTRVLLVEGDPYWDTRSLARLVGTHPGFELTALYALGDDRRVTVRGEADALDGPLTPEALGRFDVVVLGREVQRLMDEPTTAALVGFVAGGGAVVFARGEAFTGNSPAARAGRMAAESISPVVFGARDTAPLRLVVSEAARGNPLTELGDDTLISRMPGMLAATRVEGAKAASVVLLEQADGGQATAAVTTLRVGRGVSMAVLTDGLWRWELLPSSLEQAESVYAVFWTRALQWLASGGEFLPGQDVSLSLDRLSAEPGQPVEMRVQTRYAELPGTEGLQPELRLVAPDGSVTQLGTLQQDAAGGAVAQATPDTLGVYRVELTIPGRPGLVDPARPLTAYFSVVDRSPERRDTTARPEVLRALTAERGGQCLSLDEVEPVIEHLEALRAVRSADDTWRYRFATWPVFGLIVGGFGLAWVMRRRGGLL